MVCCCRSFEMGYWRNETCQSQHERHEGRDQLVLTSQDAPSSSTLPPDDDDDDGAMTRVQLAVSTPVYTPLASFTTFKCRLMCSECALGS